MPTGNPTLAEVIEWLSRVKDNLVFLQIGAFDGRTADRLFPLVGKHSLSGTLVEPQRQMYESLRRNYATFGRDDFQFVLAAIYDRDGEFPLYRVKARPHDPYWLPGLASLDRRTLIGHSHLIEGLKDCIEVESTRCMTFESLCREYSIGVVDILIMDTEGLDALILNTIELEYLMPGVIQFEHKHLSVAEYANALRRLSSLGYRFSFQSEDTIAFQGAP